ncbi:DUF3861 family protein [Kingella kingae]
MQFSAPNHDDIFEIVARIKQRDDMGEETAVRFACLAKRLWKI